MILLLGGTSDSLMLGNALIDANLGVRAILSTATPYGSVIGEHSFKGDVRHGRLDEEGLLSFCLQHKIEMIIDASHPYAQVLSKQAMQVASTLKCHYLRYERPVSKKYEAYKRHPDIHFFASQQEAALWLNTSEGNILLTTGSKEAHVYADLLNQPSRLRIRYLPTSEQTHQLEVLGFHANQLIGMQGPFSKAMNHVMINDMNIKYLVTKESGEIGAFEEKVDAALEGACEVLVIERPKLAYQKVYENYDKIVKIAFEIFRGEG